MEQLKSGFKRTIEWSKYTSEMTNQTKTNYLNYLIDPTFTKVNRLFVLSFENEEDRTSFSKYYVSKVEINDLKLVKIMITQLVIYWTMNTFQNITN